jgi:glutamine cyclotransferase
MRILFLMLCVLAPLACAQEDPMRYGYRVLNTYPHDITAFTQGLFYHEGFLYEGTGKRGLSKLSKLNLEDASELITKSLSQRYFGEGI